jgi:Rieske Fe-S protein
MSDWSRRDLLKQALALGLPPCCTTPGLAPDAVTADGSAVRIDLRRAPELRQKGGSARLTDRSRGVDLIVAHAARRRYVALDALCTHGQGPVAFKPKHRTVQCTCWGRSEFALDGRVIGGPARRPLRAYPVAIAGDTLTIRLDAAA